TKLACLYAHIDSYYPQSMHGEYELHSVEDQLVDDQAAVDRGADIPRHVLNHDCQPDSSWIHVIGEEKVGGQIPDIFGKIDLREIVGVIEFLMDERHGPNTVLAFLKHVV